MPPIIILENVCNAPWQQIAEEFQRKGYQCHFMRLDTKHYYIPTRARASTSSPPGPRTRRSASRFPSPTPTRARTRRARRLWRTGRRRCDPCADPRPPPSRRSSSTPTTQGFTRADRCSPCPGRTTLASPRSGRGASPATSAPAPRRDSASADPSPTGRVAAPCPTTPGTTGVRHRRTASSISWTSTFSVWPRRTRTRCTRRSVWNLSQNVDRTTGSGAAGICPCLTPSMVPFVTNRGGPLVGVEALSLQGIPVEDLLLTRESEGQMSDLAGNAMTTTVVGACMLSALILMKDELVEHGHKVASLLKKDEALRMSSAGKSWGNKAQQLSAGSRGCSGAGRQGCRRR